MIAGAGGEPARLHRAEARREGRGLLTGEQAPSDRPDDAGEKPTSVILDSLAALNGEKVPFSAIVEAAGSRVHGLALLLFVIPEVPPLPLPSLSSILGIPLVIISVHLAVFGEGQLVPARVQSISIPRSALIAAARYLGPMLRWLEKLSRPRWLWLTRRERPIGGFCLYLSLILLLPIPLLNAAPAACLAAIALGMIQRDGVFIAIGMTGTVVMTGVVVGLIDVASGWLIRPAGL
jgi:hypothetical protein